MKKIKFFFGDGGNIASLLFLSIVMMAISYYAFLEIGWFIAAVIYIGVIVALIISSNKSYKIVNDLKNKGYNV